MKIKIISTQTLLFVSLICNKWNIDKLKLGNTHKLYMYTNIYIYITTFNIHIHIGI